MLPVVVGQLAVGDVSLQPQPSVRERQHPVVCQSQTHLRHGARIDAQRLRSAAQRVVLQLHRLLLAAHGEHSVEPSQLAVCLLHHHAARIVHRHRHVCAVAYSPPSRGVDAQVARHHRSHISVVLIERAQTILVGVEPQRRPALRERALHLHSIPQPSCRTEFPSITGFLPRLRTDSRTDRKKQACGI